MGLQRHFSFVVDFFFFFFKMYLIYFISKHVPR